jgi:hypothetical protein
MIAFARNHLEDLGVPFVTELQRSFQNIHTLKGRNSLYALMTDTIARGRRTEFINHRNQEAVDTLTIIAGYSAYLLTAKDGKYRQTFDLLYAMESLNRERDDGVKAKEREEYEKNRMTEEEEEEEDYRSGLI